jgi:riboflavin synthase
MFTGIIESIGKIVEITDLGGGLSLKVESELGEHLQVDDSISVNGVCLTVVARGKDYFKVDVVEETIRKTSLAQLKANSIVNLERAMMMNARLDGHIVQGHVDATGVIESIVMEGTGRLVTISYPAAFKDHIIGRGSIAVDGISLTVAREEGNQFVLAIIPYTWDHTNFIAQHVGSVVNLEFDMIGKYVIKYLRLRDGIA